MIIVFTDSDGVLKDSKNPVSQEIIEVIKKAREDYGIVVIRITGAPSHHLADGLLVDRAFGESGGVEVLPDGRIIVVPDAEVAVDALRLLKQLLGIAVDVHDGLAHTAYGTFGLEGVRHTTLTLFFGAHPLYPNFLTRADPDAIAALIQEFIDSYCLPLYMLRGSSHTYEYIDVGHHELMKKERTVNMILADSVSNNIIYNRIYYLGDSGNDAGAMQLSEIIPVTFSNGTPQIQKIVTKRNGIMVEKPGPYGGSVEFFRRLIDGTL